MRRKFRLFFCEKMSLKKKKNTYQKENQKYRKIDQKKEE